MYEDQFLEIPYVALRLLPNCCFMMYFLIILNQTHRHSFRDLQQSDQLLRLN